MRVFCLVFLLLLVQGVQGQSQFPERLPHQAVSVRWSPQGDLYATGHVNGDVRIYDNATLITVISNAHTAPIYGLAFSPDSSRIATGGEDNNLRIWNVTTGALVEEFLNVGQFMQAVEWSSNGDIIWIAPFGGPDHIIFVDIITDAYTVSQTIYRGPSEDISWKPDNTMVAIGGRGTDVVIVAISDYSLCLLDATPDIDFFEPPNEFTTSVTWHPTANIVANGKVNGWTHVWDLDSPSDTIPMLSLQANDGATDNARVPFEYTVLDIEFSADGSILNSISRDGTIRMWDAETGELLSDTNLGETILAGAFSPGSGTLVYSTYSQVDEPLRVIQFSVDDAGADQNLSIPLDVAWSPNGEMIATIEDSGTLNVMLSDQFTPVFQFAPTSPTLFDATVAWNPDGSLLAAGIGYQVYIWETTTWQLVHQFVGGDSDGYVLLAGVVEEIPEGIASIIWSSNGRYLVSGSLSYLTTAWDNQEAQMIYQAPDGSGGGPGRVWLEDGSMGDGATRLNAFTGEVVVIDRSELQNRFGPGGGTNVTAVHPNHTHIAWGTEFGFLLIYDLYTLSGVQALEVTQSEPPAPRRALTDIVWNEDGSFIVAVSRDGELYVVNLETGEVTYVLDVDGQLNAIDWNPQSNEIIYAGVSESGEPILDILDVSGIGGVPIPPTADAGAD